MKKVLKKSAAALTCAALLCSAASCGSAAANALTVDGRDIRAGIYIYYQMQALDEAYSRINEEQPDVNTNASDFDITKYSIDNIPANDWIKNRTIEMCREFTATEEMFDEYGLKLPAEQNSEIKSTVNSLWTEENMYAQYIYGVSVLGEYYEKFGIGKQSYQDIFASDYKKDAIFDYLYGEGGTKAVSAAELTAAIKDNYVLVKYFEVDPEAGNAQDYLDSLNNGTAFADVMHNYETAKEYYDVTKAMEEALNNGEEYDGTMPDAIQVAKKEEKDIQRVVAKTATAPSEDFVKALFEMNVGENKVITFSVSDLDDDDNQITVEKYYVVSKLDITADAETIEKYSETQLHSLKDEELDAAISDRAAGCTVSENPAAINKYKVQTIINSKNA